MLIYDQKFYAALFLYKIPYLFGLAGADAVLRVAQVLLREDLYDLAVRRLYQALAFFEPEGVWVAD